MHRSGEWITKGFESFRRGIFGNGGENLYVSRRGVLQRINLFDLNEDGYVDLVFCNGQAHFERPPTGRAAGGMRMNEEVLVVSEQLSAAGQQGWGQVACYADDAVK